MRGEGAPTFCKRQDPRGRYQPRTGRGGAASTGGDAPRAPNAQKKSIRKTGDSLACDASSHIGKRKGATLMTGKGKEKRGDVDDGKRLVVDDGIRTRAPRGYQISSLTP